MSFRWIRQVTLAGLICLSGCTQLAEKFNRTESDLDELVSACAKEQEHDDLWGRMRDGFQIPNQKNNPEVHHFVKKYGNYHHHILTLADRAKWYQYIITDAVERRGLPMELALLPMVESALDPFEDSHYRAAGIWQIIPSTATILGLQQDWWYDARRDIVASTEAALDYLTYLNKRFNGDWLLSIAAYNSGEGTVSRAMMRNRKLGKPTDFASLHLPKETRTYVPKLLALATIINDPEHYNLKLPRIQNEPFAKVVDVGTQIDLAFAAALAEIPMKDLYRLNPGYNRWATHPNEFGPHHLLLPVEAAEVFSQKLAVADTSEWVNWQAYQIRPGDTLSRLAKENHTTVEALIMANNLPSDQIVVNRYLLLPDPVAPYGRYSASYAACQASSCHREHQVIHRVKQGESLWKIAKQYEIKVKDIITWNNLRDENKLKLNQDLIIKL